MRGREPMATNSMMMMGIPKASPNTTRSEGSSVRSAEVVEVLPLLKPLVEQPRVVDHDPPEHPVERLLVDPVGPLHLSVQPRGAGA